MMRLALLGILLAVMALLLRSFGFRGAAVYAALGVAALLSSSASGLGELFGIAKDSALFRTDVAEYASAIAKIVGAGYLFGICAAICTELGEVGIARAVTVSGRIEVLLIALPYFKRILDLGTELML